MDISLMSESDVLQPSLELRTERLEAGTQLDSS